MVDFDLIRKEIADEYTQPHSHPWVIGFSGGKDSTLVTHLVFEFLMSLPRSKRTRPVHIVSNDTLVESPLVVSHMRQACEDIQMACPHAVAQVRS
ncbi:hypothetical protein [Methylobacterium sp. yr668]|uniref:hypothetical protein n=1 Tax=Methylobacterium sp. yr668 TaxID=1761801 RepID=UPI0008EB86C0|nr:hypothetical protein [Methylobacterium sp. yr668]SFT29401.1 DNA sulfur modification protein DndC [Methylobacterium sp. yr668]